MPDDDELHGCHTCAAPILWCVTERGKRISIDVAPDPDGEYCKLRREWDGEQWNKVVAYVPISEREFVNFPLYTTHFKTCPNRKKKDDAAST